MGRGRGLNGSPRWAIADRARRLAALLAVDGRAALRSAAPLSARAPLTTRNPLGATLGLSVAHDALTRALGIAEDPPPQRAPAESRRQPTAPVPETARTSAPVAPQPGGPEAGRTIDPTAVAADRNGRSSRGAPVAVGGPWWPRSRPAIAGERPAPTQPILPTRDPTRDPASWAHAAVGAVDIGAAASSAAAPNLDRLVRLGTGQGAAFPVVAGRTGSAVRGRPVAATADRATGFARPSSPSPSTGFPSPAAGSPDPVSDAGRPANRPPAASPIMSAAVEHPALPDRTVGGGERVTGLAGLLDHITPAVPAASEGGTARQWVSAPRPGIEAPETLATLRAIDADTSGHRTTHRAQVGPLPQDPLADPLLARRLAGIVGDALAAEARRGGIDLDEVAP